MNLQELLARAEAILEDAGVASPRVDATAIAAMLLGCEPIEVGLRRRDPVSQDFTERFDELLARRAAREPLQHILGKAWFGPVELEVGEGVFIPRPETETLADWAATLARPGDVVLDCCTGSGAIAAYVATQQPRAQVYAVERSESAAAYARKNLHNRATLLLGDALDPATCRGLRGRVNVLTCNPPYVPETDALDPEVYFDPHEAVFSGDSGMEFIQAFMPVAFELLADGGRIGVEHDDTTSKATLAAFHAAGFREVEAIRDLAGRPRFVMGVK